MFKYGRREGEIQEYVRVVPFSRANISDDTFNRLMTGTPFTFDAISRFHSDNGKLSGMPDSIKVPNR